MRAAGQDHAEMPAQPGGPLVWLPGAHTQAEGPGTAALELDGVTPVLAGGGARSAAAVSFRRCG